MNANRLRTVIVLASLPLSAAFFASVADAAPQNQQASGAATPGQFAGRENLSREDVAQILKQAQDAIKQGNFDQADALLKRTEAAKVHYPVFHFGATPMSVRKELALAQSNRQPSTKLPGVAPAANQSRPAAQPLGARTPNKNSADPFLGRNQVLPQAPNTQPIPPSMPGGENADPSLIEATATRELPTMNRPTVNPFAPPATGTQAARYESAPNAGYGAQQAGYAESPGGVSNARASTADAPLLGSPAADAGNWTLPDAPLPPGIGEIRKQSAAPDDLAMPRQPQSLTNPTADTGSTAGPDAKQQALENIAAARRALNAGDLDMAEQLARQASELGVPESQFLPSEDRPSLLSWDILRARQQRPNAQATAANMPAGGNRYADRLDQAPAAAQSAPRPAATGPLDSNDRWAMLPDPINLPPESAPPAESAVEPAAPVTTSNAPAGGPDASALMRAGEAALVKHDQETARELLGQAYEVRDQLPEGDKQRLQERLQMLSAEAAQARTDSQRLAVNTPAAQLPPINAEPLSPADAMPAEQVAPPAELPVPPTTSDPSVAITDAQPAQTGAGSSFNLLETAGMNEQSLARLFSAEIGKRQAEAKRLQTEDPERALAVLREAQDLVKKSKLSEDSRRELLKRIQLTLDSTEKYVAEHKVEIEIDRQSKAVKDQVERDRETRLKIQQKIAEMVDEFNRLRDEQRYAEMEIVARRLNELAPDEQVVKQVYSMSKFIRRNMMNADLMDKKEESFWAQLNSVEEAAINPVAADGHETDFDHKHWDSFVKNRKGSKDRLNRRTEREMEIERRLKTPVMLHYQETPLSTVIENLQQLAGVNIHLDQRGLDQEGVTSSTPINVNLNKEISLKSALNLILEPLHLSYVIKDEVLKITSEQLRDGEIYPDIYNVADLVIPIPNFVPSSSIGLQGLIQDAYGAMGYGGNGNGLPGPNVLVNESRSQKAAAANDNVLAQQMAGSPIGTPGSSAGSVPIGAGPGGMGGGANADFDSLIDLIVSTVHTETWAENGGGEAEIRPFPTNLSLVISQTQAVHEEIADLLAQLRRLQDLQVTIEVRFIRLNDSFFERIGVDFDMDVVSNTNPATAGVNGSDTNQFVPTQSATVGLNRAVQPTNPFPNFTSDLDIPFRQDHFDLTQLTPFGNAQQVGTFGFAILSDIEAYFLVEAAQGDRRTNVLNAPKVTLFNGQQAFVSDSTQRPFVIGVIPVVGEFAAAQQPVIVVLNEGTMMTIQAVVSDDRRYVRLTVVPFFTQIGDVQEFTFEGSTSSTSSSSTSTDDDDGSESEDESTSEARSGVTVQLPSFSFVSVVTTVSVPDGGTVLLGGIKRLSEGRNEFGVPLLSKVPYINRLFKNVAIGRETDSLMMMVTPRIIIQEEEEERLGVSTTPTP